MSAPVSLAGLLGDPEEWMGDALCAEVDAELFFPEKGGSVRGAKQVCGRCGVQAECLAYALAHDLRYGIWGGVPERERRRMRAHMNQRGAAA